MIFTLDLTWDRCLASADTLKYYEYNCGLVAVYVMLSLHLLALASVHHTVNITHLKTSDMQRIQNLAAKKKKKYFFQERK